MGLDVVVAEILEEGKRRAEELQREAAKEAQALRDDAERRLGAERERLLGQARKEAERHRAQSLARAGFESTKRVLDAQKAAWDELRAKVLDGLRALPADRAQRIARALLKKAKAALPDGKLFAREQDRALAPESGYAWGGARPMVGGFVVESPSGEVVLDYRFETLLEDMWKDLMRDESGALLGGARANGVA